MIIQISNVKRSIRLSSRNTSLPLCLVHFPAPQWLTDATSVEFKFGRLLQFYYTRGEDLNPLHIPHTRIF